MFRGLVCLCLSMALSAAAFAARPTPDQRLAIFRALVAEMERLDGVSLEIRARRPEPWSRTIEGLEAELLVARNDADVARVFNRLDQTYPSLHTYNELGVELAQARPAHRARAVVGFGMEWVAPERVTYRIGRVDRPELDVRVGDELVAINGRKMADWAREAFIFCKFARKEQCEFDLASQFFGELLSWERSQGLRYTLRRGSREWSIDVPVGEAPPRPPKDPHALECAREPHRYPGFRLAFAGNRACVFESETDPATAVLRITSFQYRLVAPEQKIRSVEQEVEALYPWWKEHATWKHLVIDVIDNGGGNSPMPYYRLLLREPFQEQYVQFRKSAELENAKLRLNDNGIFWGSQGQELWFQNLIRNGVYGATPARGFLPPVPQFCADDSRDCSEGLVAPLEHPFRGRVSVLLNSYCVSSCDGFVWQMYDKLKGRVRFFGQPNAADPAYSRLTIHVYLDATRPEGFRLEVGPIREELALAPWLSQTVYVTRSVSARGEPIDGNSEPLEKFVPWTLENGNDWPAHVLDAALSAGLGVVP